MLEDYKQAIFSFYSNEHLNVHRVQHPCRTEPQSGHSH